MAVIAILTVNLHRGISLLDVTVLNQAIILSRRKSVVAASKLSVVTKSVTTKNLLLNKKENYLKLSLEIVFFAFYQKKLDTFLKFVFYTKFSTSLLLGTDGFFSTKYDAVVIRNFARCLFKAGLAWIQEKKYLEGIPTLLFSIVASMVNDAFLSAKCEQNLCLVFY